MSENALDGIVHGLLYDGYILYPYRPWGRKNQGARFSFGRIYPRSYSVAQNGAAPCLMQTDCLLNCLTDTPELTVCLRFLHPLWREVGVVTHSPAANSPWTEPAYRIVPESFVNGSLLQSWQEAVEREIKVPVDLSCPVGLKRLDCPFSFAASRSFELIRDQETGAATALIRRQESISGALEIEVKPVAPALLKILLRVRNETPFGIIDAKEPDTLAMRTFASVHSVLQVRGGEFISLTEPPMEYRPFTAECKNIGTWPVLIGKEEMGQRDVLLSSPIHLYDYPKFASEKSNDIRLDR